MFAFACKAKALSAADLVPRSMDVEGLFHYISLKCCPGRHTLFSGIEKLPADRRILVEFAARIPARFKLDGLTLKYGLRQGACAGQWNHRSARRDHNHRLWALLKLKMWHRPNMGGQSRDELREWVRESVPGTARS
jgi:hypothetical protein